MPLDLATIPSASRPPAGATPSPVRRLIEERFLSRRSILKGIVTSGMVLGIAALDLLPGRNNAEAHIVGRAPWQWWHHCADYTTASRRTNWKWCNPDAARVSERYCKSDYNRHRTAHEQVSSCEVEAYRRDYRCWNISDTKVINAWVWRRGQTGGDRPDVICSDGKTYVLNDCGSDYSYKSACRRYL